MIKKIKALWKWGVEKFLNKQFLIFGIIGLINTLIHVGTLAVSFIWLDKSNSWQVIVANSIAFTVASLFSYFANNKFTFKNDNVSMSKLVQTILVFGVRLLMTNGLTFAFGQLFRVLDLGVMWRSYGASIIAMIIMIPLCYLVLEKILKVKKTEEVKDEKLL